ncbi:MAG: 1-aminocyclopropane-1-carboxylate deaminase [Bacteroidia bacterium]|nr:1-aminocyclopropane-1-carboxylate deaminase [Bacteroidia bacterium]
MSNITTDKIQFNLFTEKKVQVNVLRLDNIHPIISGNKWFKLRYYLDEANQQNKKAIVTFGGAWSNHIIATAAVCRENNFPSFGIIRGEEFSNLSPTLIMAKELGMQLVFISREDYHLKKIPGRLNNSEYYFINEGGYGMKGAEGAATILDYCNKENYTHICCAAGTGTMTAGLIKAALPMQEVIGFSVLKNNFELEENIKSLLMNNEKNFRLIHDYHFGGYAKYKPELIDFMNEFYRQTNIPSDFVYTAKMFYAINDLIQNNFFNSGNNLLLIHSGGLQGNASLDKGTLIF